VGLPAQLRGHHLPEDADDQVGQWHVHGGDAKLDGEHAVRPPMSRKQAEGPSWVYLASAQGNRGPAVHPGAPSVLQSQGVPPDTGTPRPNEPTKGAVTQRRRGVLPQHLVVPLPD